MAEMDVAQSHCSVSEWQNARILAGSSQNHFNNHHTTKTRHLTNSENAGFITLKSNE